MTHLAFWLRYSTDDARTLAELLCVPVFDQLERTAIIEGSRRKGHSRKTVETIEQQLRAPKSEGVELDNGRAAELDAAASFRFDRAADAYPSPHKGYMVLRYEPHRLEEFVEACSSTFAELDGALGYISLEPSESQARCAVHGQVDREARAREDMTSRRQREWKAQGFYIREFKRKIPRVEWGIYLSAGHLEALCPDTLRASGAFHQVEMLDETRAFLQLTRDPQDAARDGYEDKLAAAREALGPLLLDVSDIELDSEG